MNERTFLIDSEENREACARAVMACTSAKIMEVTIKPFKRNRSKAANAYYWGVVLAILADHTGHTAEELHELFKLKFLRREAVTVLGEGLLMHPTTTSLKVDEFTEYLEQIRILAAEKLGCSLPDADGCYA
ncbi:MAG: hypothetical protein IKE42_28550 [Aquamicrobium sp.]|nr:hypothetical protein [Aquamicrobium sp.]